MSDPLWAAPFSLGRSPGVTAPPTASSRHRKRPHLLEV